MERPAHDGASHASGEAPAAVPRAECRLALHARTVVSARGPRSTELCVVCPSRRTTTSARECAACPRCTEISLDPLEGFVACRGEPAPEGNAADSAPAERTPVTAVMSADVVALRPDVDVAAATRVFLEHELGGTAVVDGDGRPIGVLGRDELLRAWSERPDGAPHRAVGAVMTPIVITLLETAPVSAALRLLGVRGTHPVPVVAGNGRVVGILSPAELLRWLLGAG